MKFNRILCFLLLSAAIVTATVLARKHIKSIK